MMRIKAICFIFMCVFACTKVNQWKQPVHCCFELAYIFDNQTLPGLSIDSVVFNFDHFIFEAQRNEGANVEVVDIIPSKKISSNQACSEALKFKLPSGWYKSMKFTLSNQLDSNISIQVYGNYQMNGLDYKLMLELNSTKFHIFDFMDAAQPADLINFSEKNCNLSFNVNDLLDGLTKEQLNAADSFNYMQQNTIYISSTKNSQIYQLLLDNLSNLESNTIRFE